MLTGNKKLLLLVVAATLILQRSTATGGYVQSSQVKPGCQDKCGNVSVPYPFGIGNGCFLNENFNVTCNNDTDNGVILNTCGTPLLEINLSLGEARVQSPVAKYCNYTNIIGYTTDYIVFSVGTSFKISDTKNKFTSIGCATLAYLTVDKGKHTYSSACGSFCYDEGSIDDDDSVADCSDIGCCQTAIPGNLDLFYLQFSIIDVDNTQVQNFSPCSYGFVVAEDLFKFQPSYVKFSNFQESYGDEVPLVLDWAVGNETCEEVMKNQSSYACRATNSVCINSTNGPGYLCNCSQGYEGNPYLYAGSCQGQHRSDRSISI